MEKLILLSNDLFLFLLTLESQCLTGSDRSSDTQNHGTIITISQSQVEVHSKLTTVVFGLVLFFVLFD